MLEVEVLVPEPEVDAVPLPDVPLKPLPVEDVVDDAVELPPNEFAVPPMV